LESDNDLTLVGANWMSANTDDYVMKNQVDSGATTEAIVCKGKPEYDDPCPTGGSSNMFNSFNLIGYISMAFVLLCTL